MHTVVTQKPARPRGPIVDATADVAPPARPADSEPSPMRHTETAVARALAQYPGVLLWNQLCELMPLDAAIRTYEAATDAVRRCR